MAVMARAELMQSQESGASFSSPSQEKGFKHLEPSSATLLSHKLGAGLDVEQLEHKLESIQGSFAKDSGPTVCILKNPSFRPQLKIGPQVREVFIP